MNTLGNPSAAVCDASSVLSFWHLRDDHHALTWLRLSTAWANAGRSGLPPLTPFRIWGLEVSEVTNLLSPLQLLPHVLSLRQPDSPGIRTQMALHPQSHLRWALLCLRHHGQLHARAWSVFADEDACMHALSGYLCQQWAEKVGCNAAPLFGAQTNGRFNPPIFSDAGNTQHTDASRVDPSPYQGLLDTSLWDSLIRMHVASEVNVSEGNTSAPAHHDNIPAAQGQDTGADMRGVLRREELAL